MLATQVDPGTAAAFGAIYGGVLFIGLVVVLLLSGAASVFVAPMMAPSRGHSAAIWFFIGVFWLFVAGAVMWFVYLVIASMVYAATGNIVVAVVASLLPCFVALNLPIFVLMMMPRKGAGRGRSSRRGSAGDGFAAKRRRQLAVRDAQRPVSQQPPARRRP